MADVGYAKVKRLHKFAYRYLTSLVTSVKNSVGFVLVGLAIAVNLNADRWLATPNKRYFFWSSSHGTKHFALLTEMEHIRLPGNNGQSLPVELKLSVTDGMLLHSTSWDLAVYMARETQASTAIRCGFRKLEFKDLSLEVSEVLEVVVYFYECCCGSSTQWALVLVEYLIVPLVQVFRVCYSGSSTQLEIYSIRFAIPHQ